MVGLFQRKGFSFCANRNLCRQLDENGVAMRLLVGPGDNLVEHGDVVYLKGLGSVCTA